MHGTPTLMLISRSRQTLINAIVYFAANTRYCGKVKLFKLLYLLDFAHFRETGRSVTGLEYRAWKMGPVSLDLMQEWDEPEADFSAAIGIRPELVIDYTRELAVPRAEFDDGLFTKRELRLMAELAARFRDDLTKPLVNVTHAERGPWDKIWDAGRGENNPIPYSLAIPDDDPNRDAILQAAQEYESIAEADARHH
ncbi:MAG: Panacea domain-containing protein [Gammaproteobacteria bacterium]|nr:Panacea domain-containing protein [Gammaproteobacteria bacterium]